VSWQNNKSQTDTKMGTSGYGGINLIQTIETTSLFKKRDAKTERKN